MMATTQQTSTLLNLSRLRKLFMVLGAAILALVIMVPSQLPNAVAVETETFHAEKSSIDTGYLDWGIKDSLRTDIGSNGVTVHDGAIINNDGTYRFSLDSGSVDVKTQTTSLRFLGSIQFQNHLACTHGEQLCNLHATYSNPRLVISPSEQSLYVTMTSIPRNGTTSDVPTVFGEILLAHLDVSAANTHYENGVSEWSNVVSVLADDPAPEATRYDAGTQFDPLSFTYHGELSVPGAPTPGIPNVQEDGSIIGDKNSAGAYTQISPGVQLAKAGSTLKVQGRGFTKNVNHSGVYVLFGYMVKAPSAGASAGNGYEYSPGGGGSGQKGQLFIAWPGNHQTGSAAQATFTSQKNGSFSATGLYAVAEFTGQSGNTVNCLDGTVVCGVMTIGAHGGRDANLETFTPVFFQGQKVPTKPVVVPDPPVKPEKQEQTPPVMTPSQQAKAVEGSLVWGVKQSFRSYITSPVAKGSIQVFGGAVSQNGLFWFGQAWTDWDAGRGTGSTSYGGSVRFTGHSGILDLTFSNPVVRIDSQASGTLLVSVNGAQIPVGSLHLAAAMKQSVSGGVSYSNVPVTLTGAGAQVFSFGSSQFYAAGESMDALSFVVGAASTSTPGGFGAVVSYVSAKWVAPPTPPASTGLWVDPKKLKNIRPGTELTAVGEGFQPNEKDIKVVVYSEPKVLEQHLVADESGTASWTGVLPLDTRPGRHTLTFQGSVNRGVTLRVLDTAPVQGCVVEGATLDWGFKESFRSYISGSIAHGEWQVSDGAEYNTPTFRWVHGTGVLDAESFTGKVSFPGTVRFTGHDGLLNTKLKNPSLVFAGQKKAYLLLDVSGVTMEDAMAGKSDNAVTVEQVSFVELDLTGGKVEISEDGRTITGDLVPTSITSEGYKAFPNYEEGTSFDPVSFRITAEAECGLASLEEPVVSAAAPVAKQVQQGQDLSWLWWVGGGLLVSGLCAGVLVLWLRRRGQTVNTGTSLGGEC